MKTRNNKLALYLDRHFSSEQFSSVQIFGMLSPLILDQFFIFLIGLLTSSMISSSGQDSVAAVSLVDPITYMIMSLFLAVAAGGTVIVAQYKGKGDEKQMKKAAGQVIFTTFLVATLCCIILIVFSTPIIHTIFKSSDKQVLDKAQAYMIGYSLSLPAFAIFQGIFSVLRAIGDTKTCLWLTVIINAIHLFASLVFINFLKLDILGTALSFNLARLVGAAIACFAIFRTHGMMPLKIKDIFHFDFKLQKKIISIGVPFALEQLFFSGGRMLTQTYMVVLGTAAIAANAISASVSNLFYAAGFGVGTLAITVVGQCIGAGDIPLARKYGKLFIWLGTVISIISIAVLYPLSPLILMLFSPQPETLPIINQVLLIGIVPIPFFWALSNITPSILRAAGDVNFTSAVSLATMWIFRVLLGYVFAIPLKMGIQGVWACIGIEWAVRSLIFGIRLKGEKWHKKQLTAND